MSVTALYVPYKAEFEPLLLPGNYVQVRGKVYQVVDVRPAFEWDYKEVGVASEGEVDLRQRGLKGSTNELLHVRLKVYGLCRHLFRVEGGGGPVYGGWGAVERWADARTPESALEFFIFEDEAGWLYMKYMPIVAPAWFKLRARGYVYLLREAAERPAQVTRPPFIAEPR